jgi:tRNA splicing ligase
MRHHLKSWHQMLKHKRLNEVIATDKNFANENQLSSKILYVADNLWFLALDYLHLAHVHNLSVNRKLKWNWIL